MDWVGPWFEFEAVLRRSGRRDRDKVLKSLCLVGGQAGDGAMAEGRRGDGDGDRSQLSRGAVRRRSGARWIVGEVEDLKPGEPVPHPVPRSKWAGQRPARADGWQDGAGSRRAACALVTFSSNPIPIYSTCLAFALHGRADPVRVAASTTISTRLGKRRAQEVGALSRIAGRASESTVAAAPAKSSKFDLIYTGYYHGACVAASCAHKASSCFLGSSVIDA